jgi:transglutaminase-like putative cysteine protease
VGAKVAFLNIKLLLIFLILTSPSLTKDNALNVKCNVLKNDYPSTITLYSYAWLSCYSLYGFNTTQNFQVYAHIPVITADQAPIMITDVHTIPKDRIVSYQIIGGYSGQNVLLEVTIDSINRSEMIYLYWKSHILIQHQDYVDFPDSRELVPEENYSEEIRQWLNPTIFIQSDHEEIRATAELLSMNTSDIITIVDNIIGFVANNITYIYGLEDALGTLRRGYGVCTGKANLATALLRACGIPSRVIMVYPTHYLIEYYLHSYGWVKAESTHGAHPWPNDVYTVAFTAYTCDETNQSVINGQSPYSGVIAYWGTSSQYVYLGIGTDFWHQNISTGFTVDTVKANDTMAMTKSVWNYYCNYSELIHLGAEEHLLQAVDYQKQALQSIQEENLTNYLYYLEKSYDRYYLFGVSLTSSDTSPLFTSVSNPVTSTHPSKGFQLVCIILLMISLTVFKRRKIK